MWEHFRDSGHNRILRSFLLTNNYKRLEKICNERTLLYNSNVQDGRRRRSLSGVYRSDAGTNVDDCVCGNKNDSRHQKFKVVGCASSSLR